MTAYAGLKVAAYDSYNSVGCEVQDRVSFGRVLDTAFELKAPTIRVWSGDRSSRDAYESIYKLLVEYTRKVDLV